MSALMAMAQNRTNPDVADYYIKGNLSIERGPDGKLIYKLSNIDKRGIIFDNPGSAMRGFVTDEEDVRFRFAHYDILPISGISTPDINTELDFWRYDESIHEWQPDGETRQASRGVEENKSMVLMLVLDCSSSLGSDFSFVQEAAKAFIKSLLDASAKGNIKIGIVGFSKISATEFFPITRLTNDSYYDMCQFINSRSIQNGTALYYAMDKAIDVMEDYCNTSIPSNEPLSAAMMVTFTDGLDQTSRDESRDILTADKYYTELLNKIRGKRFNGIPLQSKMRGVQGDDIETQAQLGKFEQIGNSLAEFKLLNNVSELGQEFKDIAEGLLNEWAVLNCYVPNSFEGRVAWTYRTARRTVESPREPRQPRERGKFLLGINGGVGIGNHQGYETYGYGDEDIYSILFAGSVGFDFAFPVSEKINLGLYTSFGYEFAARWHDYVYVNAGPLMLINFKQGGSLYLGGGLYYGLDMGNGYSTNVIGGGARIGYKFKNGLYLFLEKNYYGGNKGWWDYYCHMKGDNSILHVGYFF